MKHTLGPWKLINNGEYIVGLGDPYENRIADLSDCSNTTANAHLIVVAPELLTFVESVLAEQLSHSEHGDQVLIRQVEELIRKVEGKV